VGREIERAAGEPIENLMGKTTIAQLIETLGECAGLLTNDSGPAHVMAALGKQVWIVWSGVADPGVWAPRGGNVSIFENRVPCAPCSLAACRVESHPCMDAISPGAVIQSILAALDR
jgi:ADP-heptose:LPS heptosyltransferase